MRKAAVAKAKAHIATPIAIPTFDGSLEVTAATIVYDQSDGRRTVDNRRIVFVTLAHDSDAQNPLEDGDGMGRIQSLSKWHHNTISVEEFETLMADDKDAVALSYFEHGNCQWFVRDVERNRHIPDFRWDGTDVAGVWTPGKHLRDDEAKGLKGAKRAAKMREWAAQACETYTSWCNGDVYGYIIEVYDVRLSDDGEACEDRRVYQTLGEPLYEDACWGHVGSDWALEATREAVNNIPAEYVTTFNVAAATATTATARND